MNEKDRPLITITGILGKQGRSAAQSLLISGRYRVRGITRRVDSLEAKQLIKQGIEMVNVPLDIGYQKEFINAFRGSYGVFMMTPGISPPDTHEFELGRQLADAAVEAGVQHVVFSSLENVERITNGKKFAPHFTDKGKVEDYIRSLPITSSFLYMSFFYTNLAEFYTPVKAGDELVFPIYLPKDFRAPFVDPLTATGPAVLEMFDNPKHYSTRSLPVIGEILSPREMVETFSRVTGKKAVYRSVYDRKEFLHYFPALASNPELVDEIIGMAEYAVEYGYFQRGRDLQWSRKINPGSLTWEQFLMATKWQGEHTVY
jgi:uncharacterized protein YbjT (DUF2867 family)